jgi:soluble lytic murein transglycosylase-like protein
MKKSAIPLTILILLSVMPALALPLEDPGDEQAELRVFLEQTIDDADSFEDRYDAEVWLVDMSARLQRFIKDAPERLQLLKAVHREARAAELKPDLVLALIQIESRFDRYAVSRVGAQGLMQVMPFWKNEIGRPDDNLTELDTNLQYGCRILQFYLAREKGNLTKALARYNGSVGKTWYPELVMNAWYDYWIAGDM